MLGDDYRRMDAERRKQQIEREESFAKKNGQDINSQLSRTLEEC